MIAIDLATIRHADCSSRREFLCAARAAASAASRWRTCWAQDGLLADDRRAAGGRS